MCIIKPTPFELATMTVVLTAILQKPFQYKDLRFTQILIRHPRIDHHSCCLLKFQCRRKYFFNNIVESLEFAASREQLALLSDSGALLAIYDRGNVGRFPIELHTVVRFKNLDSPSTLIFLSFALMTFLDHLALA